MSNRRVENFSAKIKSIENRKRPIVIEDEPPTYDIYNFRRKQVKNEPSIDPEVIPWISTKTIDIKNPLVRLHNEIIEFTEYIQPSEQEHAYRIEALERVRVFLAKAVPDATLETFGSFRTKLYLPNADIDMVMIDESQSDKSLYKKVAAALMSQSGQFDNINLIANAKVPIIKFVEIQTQIHFDLSFNKLDGIKQLKELQKAFDIYPEMRYILFIVKCMLRQRDLHETYSGGVGSFLLFQMILAFLREYRKDCVHDKQKDSIKNTTLGEYLLRFLDFYAGFDVQRKRIIMQGGGGIVNKPCQDDRFSLISPQDANHDIGNSSYKIKDIFKVFQNRYNFMINFNFKPRESCLRYILNPCDQKFTFLK